MDPFADRDIRGDVDAACDGAGRRIVPERTRKKAERLVRELRRRRGRSPSYREWSALFAAESWLSDGLDGDEPACASLDATIEQAEDAIESFDDSRREEPDAH